MKIYFIVENKFNNDIKNTAGSKAREDLFIIFKSMGFSQLSVNNTSDRKSRNPLGKIYEHIVSYNEWNRAIQTLESGDILIIQFPLLNHTLLFGLILKKLKKQDIRTILLIHDLNSLRYISSDNTYKQRARIYLEEVTALNKSDCLISHNKNMSSALVKLAKNKRTYQIIELEMFDYLMPDNKESDFDFSLGKPIVIAGNLHKIKAGYAYCLPKNDVKFNLYGAGYNVEVQDNVFYKGVFSPEDLPFNIEGSFGLVWDGLSSDTCEGSYGQYLRINNPHKLSLYLSIGLPVIVWEEAAVASFVMDNNCGFTVGSLQEISDKVSSITESEYDIMKRNAKQISEKLKAGYFTKQAMSKALEFCCCK